MLALQNGSVSNIYMDEIFDMICQLFHLHLEQYYFQQQQDISSQH